MNSGSVKWFLDKLIEHQIIKVNQTTYEGKYKHENLLEQAKAMHKEEIKTAFIIGDLYADDYFDDHSYKDEQYYKKTFKCSND
jgi:hypothetical protein